MKKRFVIAGMVMAMMAATGCVVQETPVKQTLGVNEPAGTPRGVCPGRVVWAHAPGAASWDESRPEWYDDAFNDQAACDAMVDTTVCTVAGAANAAEGWEAIFRHFNGEHGRGAAGYRAGETVAIKVNNNNTASHRDSEEINASPQMVCALLRSLTERAGVPQECIVVAEPSRYITDYLYEKCHAAFPGVRFVDHDGGDGREKAEFVADAMHYSKDNGQLARGIATAFADADYVINMALLKGHVGQGVTQCGKNWYGAMSIHADWRKNFHNNFNQSADGTPKYITFVDFMGHKDLGGKCVLWLIDGLYGCRNVGGAPGPRWQMAPFDGAWPSSLLGSMDPVAIDMVGLDFLTNEFPDMPDTAYSDMYLHEAAMAGDAPSGTVYDPEGDGTPLTSLGVAEHWNNKDEKRYTGAGKGIELVGVELSRTAR